MGPPAARANFPKVPKDWRMDPKRAPTRREAVANKTPALAGSLGCTASIPRSSQRCALKRSCPTPGSKTKINNNKHAK